MAAILIVDDRPGNREFLVTLLGYGGHRLLEATDGAEGLAVARAERPDLVIADILMPTMDGYEFVRQLRSDPTIADTRVIFYTAHYHEPEARRLADACGVAAVLTKPCEPEVVLKTVESLLGHEAATSASSTSTAEFDRDHLQLLTDKLAHKADELRRTNERLTAMVELGLQLGAERDPLRLLQAFCDAARQIVGTRYAIVGIPNNPGAAPYRYFLTSGLDLARSARIGQPAALAGVLGSVLAAGRCFRASNHGGLGAAGLPPSFPSSSALLAAPIQSPARVHGWVCLLDKLGSDSFSDGDERLARMLGAQVGRIYENGTLYADLLRHSTQLAEEVAERKRAEAEVRASAGLLHAVADGTTDAVFVKDREGKYLLFNRAAARFVGREVAEVIGKDDTELFDMGSAQKVMERDRLIMANEKVETEEETLTAAGVTRTYHATKGPYRDAGGSVAGVVGISRDITARKRTEQRLATQHAIVSILAQANDVQDAAPRLLQTICEMTNWDVGDLWIVDRQANALAPVAIWNRENLEVADFRDVTERSTFARGVGLPGRVWASEHAVWVVDVTTDPNFPRAAAAAKSGLRGGFGFPIQLGGDVLGVASFFSRESRQPDEELLRMFESLGSQIGQFIERKRAKGDLAERARLASLVGDIGLALSTGRVLKDILRLCVEAVVRHLDAAFARVWVLGEDQSTLELLASAGMYTHLDGAHGRVPVGQFKIGRIAQERRPHLTNNVVGDPQVGDQVWAAREGMVAFAGYPLLIGQRLVGVIALFARHALGASALQALAAVADQIALGIDRKRTETALQKAQQRLQHVVTSSPVILFTLAIADNRALGLSWISENIQDIFGYNPTETHGTEWWLANLHPSDRERVVAQTSGDLFTHGRISHEYRFRHRDGSFRWTQAEIRLMRNAQGQPTEAVGSWSDITERKKLEEQFQQSQKMEAVGRLAGGVAHDFNNLLTIINGYGELVLSQSAEGNTTHTLVREMVSAGDRAAGLTRQLLAFSRKAIIEPKVLDLRNVVTELERMLGRIVGEDIELTITADPEPRMVKADPGQLQQVIMNLVVNARDAMPTCGKITIEVRGVELDETYTQNRPGVQSGSYALLAVTDTGCGMDAATIARIFEPFFSTKGDQGTGLGLATVHGIVQQSGGHIAVYSEVGQGTTFKVYLPRAEQRPVAKLPQSQSPVTKGGETILLVEDEDGVRTLARFALREYGYTILEAREGTEALRLVEQHQGQIDLVVSDVVMPRMGGRELAQRIAERYPKVKVLYLSGYTDDAIVRHGILQAEVSFLQKPFTPTSLAAKVREVLDKR